ncbi:hypothetical protein TNCV_4547561 [Trichonephila clavipes]|nr:hypothetical protein TNCV_4547561 [Trichonephila clavipes]
MTGKDESKVSVGRPKKTIRLTSKIFALIELSSHMKRVFRGNISREFIFVDNSARPHMTSVAEELLETEDICKRDYIATCFPHLNPIKHE